MYYITYCHTMGWEGSLSRLPKSKDKILLELDSIPKEKDLMEETL
jgi:hypothetical protein